MGLCDEAVPCRWSIGRLTGGALADRLARVQVALAPYQMPVQVPGAAVEWMFYGMEAC